MKSAIKIIIVLVIIALVPLVIGFFQPKERIIMEKAVIDKMYFFVLGDITNHWEEAQWRHDIDTIIQSAVIDGQDAWIEYYNNGDSVLLITQKTTENDYIRLILTPKGEHLNRIITIADYNGKTAIRFTEEALENNPFKRFMIMVNDPIRERIKNYLADLSEKYAADAEEDDSGF